MSNYFEIIDDKQRRFFFRIPDVMLLELKVDSFDPERHGATVEVTLRASYSYDCVEAYFRSDEQAKAVYEEVKARLLGAEAAKAG